MFDGNELGESIVGMVRGFMEREIAPLKAENEDLKARLKALEDRPPPENAPPPSLDALWSAIQPEAEEIIREAAERAVAALPKPKDGEPGKDAANIVEALKDAGELVLTLQDGRLIRTGIRDGKDGKKGKDGFGFDDMDVAVLDDDRTLELSFRRGDEEKAFTLKWPTVLDRGVFKIDRELPYEPGDGVTWGGQFFICNEKTNDKPDLSKDGKPWRLAVRKGRDGKDAKVG